MTFPDANFQPEYTQPSASMAPSTTDAGASTPKEMTREEFAKSVFQEYKEHFRFPDSKINEFFDENDFNKSNGLDVAEQSSAFKSIKNFIMEMIAKITNKYYQNNPNAQNFGDEDSNGGNQGSYINYGDGERGAFFGYGNKTKLDENGNIAADPESTTLYLGFTTIDTDPNPFNPNQQQSNPDKIAIGIFGRLKL